MFKYALLATLAVVLAFPAAAQGSPSASHSVNINVPTIRVLTLTGGDVTMSISSVETTDTELTFTGSSSYNMLTNGSDDKITAVVASVPEGLSLTGTYAAPGSATGGTDVDLTTTATSVVTGLARQRANGQSISYTATAGLDVDPGDYTFDLTYTILAN